jgi:hypothetical protein
MMLWLKILGLFITSIGASIAILGETRRGRRLTAFGKTSLVLIVAGFLTSITLEVLQWKSEHNRQRVQRAWDDMLNQPITGIKLIFLHRKEMPVDDFFEYLGQMQIKMATSTSVGKERYMTRTLKLLTISKDINAENRIRLAAVDDNAKTIGVGADAYLMKKGLPEETRDAKRKESPYVSAAPKEEPNTSSNVERRVVGKVIGKTAIINGWIYSSDINHDWTNPNTLACGLEVSIAWSDLAFADQIDLLRDIGRISNLSLSVPPNFDIQAIDGLDFILMTANGQVLSLPLNELKFYKLVDEHETRISADLTGYDWLTYLEKPFTERQE